MATAECDPDLVPKKAEPAPAPVVAPPAPAPAPAPAPTPVAEKVTLSADTLFDFDKAVLRSDGKEKLDDLVDKLKAVDVQTIIDIGYTDRIGSKAYNLKLSESARRNGQGLPGEQGRGRRPDPGQGQRQGEPGDPARPVQRAREPQVDQVSATRSPGRNRGYRHAHTLTASATRTEGPALRRGLFLWVAEIPPPRAALNCRGDWGTAARLATDRTSPDSTRSRRCRCCPRLAPRVYVLRA